MPEVTKRRLPLPLPVAHFRVLVDRDEIGLMAVSPIEGIVDERADPQRRQTVTLRRAMSQDERLFDWYRAALNGKGTRELIVVQLDGPDGAAVNVWRMKRASPVRWTGPGFDALSNEIAMEELEVGYESVAWQRSY